MTQSADNSNSTNPDEVGTVYSAKASAFLKRYSRLILIVCLLITPVMVYGAVKSLKVYHNDLNQWLPAGFEEADTYERFCDTFGRDEMVVASWDGCLMSDESVLVFSNALTELKHVNGEPVFDRVMCGPQILDEIRAVGATERAAMNRIDRLLVGPDKDTTCVLAFPREVELTLRSTIMDRVYNCAQESVGVSREELHLGGPTIDGATIDNESKRSLEQFMGFTVVAVFLLTCYRLWDIRLALIVLTFSIFCAAISLSLLYWSGGKMNLTMIMLPTMTFIMGVAASVHMVNYYRKAASNGNPQNAAATALTDGGVPIFLSSFTTAAGMASLATSQVTPIRQFGIYSALAILCALPVILLVLPSVLHLMKGRLSRKYTGGKLEKREIKSGVSRQTSWMMNRVCRNHWWLTLPAGIAMIGLGLGVLKMEASVKIQNRFAENTKIIQDYAWLEEKLGPLVPMEVVLKFREDSEIDLWEQLEIVTEIEDSIEKTTAVNATYSAATFRPPVPSGTDIRAKMKRRLTINTWEQGIEGLEQANLLRREEDHNLWRISLRVDALNDIDYGTFLSGVNRNVSNQLDHLETTGITGVSAELTGGIPLVYKAQRQILYDLLKSFLAAFIFITLILIFILRNIRAGIIAMVPNVFPPLIVFGLMGWMGVPIEIGSVMTASVALGISVDDTIHFLTWYQRATLAGKSRYKAIQYAFDHCAKAMIDTTLICGLGVAPFLFSVFMPTVRFARLLCILLGTALAGDLVILPAILAGPAGLLFRPRYRATRKGGSKTPPSATTSNGRPHVFNSTPVSKKQ
ncbi:MAG: MMPL family transporter [Planctomycetota bacterium]